MTNEYGVKLDSNGYAPSIYDGLLDRCVWCGRTDRALQRHEVYHGAGRDKSKRLGLWVTLCDLCHDQLHHKGGGIDAVLKEDMQRRAMEEYGWSEGDFRRRFGKSYL